jgi:putative ABC transport system ATP-binding protein
MSGGQQQRVGIARAFVSRPEVIFADEPTGNLDSATTRQVLYQMMALAKKYGITFIMVTHEPDLARVADRVVTILDGSVKSNVLQSEAEKQAAREKLFADIPPESKESEEPKA